MVIGYLDLNVTEAARMMALAAELDDGAPDDGRIPFRVLQEKARRIPPVVCDLMRRMASPEVSLCAASISGLDLSPLTAIGTPAAFGEHDAQPAVRTLHRLMLLVGSLLGVPYSFVTQQRATLVLDVFPLAGRENDQLGSGSTSALEWHNEDAHHPMRADFSILLCIRNEQRVATRYAAAAELELSDAVELELRKPQFVIVPDASHTYSYNVSTSGAVAAGSEQAYSDYERPTEEFPRVPVLTGPRANPFICVDFPYMPDRLHTVEAIQALGSLKAAIERAGRTQVLKSGSIFAFDNRHGVHGRDGFSASYDGRDRWLKRLNVLRESTLDTASGEESEALRTC